MIYSVSGKLIAKRDNFIVLETAAGVGRKIFVPTGIMDKFSAGGGAVMVFTHLHVRENTLELYGFLSEAELNFFEKLISVSGVGPKSALGIMNVSPIDKLAAAITEGRAELLTRAAGIGRKIAERIILELKSKLVSLHSGETVKIMAENIDLEEALIGLGYDRGEAQRVLSRLDPKIKGLENRLKAALRQLKK